MLGVGLQNFSDSLESKFHVPFLEFTLRDLGLSTQTPQSNTYFIFLNDVVPPFTLALQMS